ncbi:MAG TPA: cobalamin-dependent protein [Jatrophihabitans sp.]|nr:cobalamin-dependent protein [Jatrophihabitans sp.]
MTRTVTDAGVVEFAEAVAGLDARAGSAVVGTLLDGGADPISVIDQVIVPSQHQVGLRWQFGEWTVAQQHAATEVALAGAAEIERRLDRRPRRNGHVVLACAEREWHALSIQLIALAMRSAGWDTTVLGAGISPLRLSRALHELGPDAAAISCSVLASLPTSRRFIEAASAAGVPTVVGGAAFGTDARRADALGATAWANSARGATLALSGLPLIAPLVPPLAKDVQSEQLALHAQLLSIRSEVQRRWRPLGQTGSVTPDSAGEVVRDCIDQVVHAVVAALITEDVSTLAETRAWVFEVLKARGDERATAHASELGEAVSGMIREYPRAYGLLSANW